MNISRTQMIAKFYKIPVFHFEGRQFVGKHTTILRDLCQINFIYSPIDSFNRSILHTQLLTMSLRNVKRGKRTVRELLSAYVEKMA
jgi:hypothetical protein